MKNSMLCLVLALLAAAFTAGCADGLDSLRESIRISGDSTTTVSTGRGTGLHAGQSMTTGIDF